MGQAATAEKPHSSSDSTSVSCPDCAGELAVEGDETYCIECGLVVREENIDRGPEWRAFDSKEKNEKSRVGAPITNTMHDKGLSTTISWQDKDAYGRSISSKKRTQMRRLRKYNKRTTLDGGGGRQLAVALGEIKRVASALDLGRQTKERACEIIRRAQRQEVFVGDVIERMVGGAVYAACREKSLGRLPGEIAEVLRDPEEGVSSDCGGEKAIWDAYGKLARELGFSLAPHKPADYLPKATSKVQAPPEARKYALTLARETEKRDEFVASGRSPSGVAAGCLYFALRKTGHRRSQDDIADAIGISTKTLRDVYYILRDLSDLPEPTCLRASTDEATETPTIEDSDTQSSLDSSETDLEEQNSTEQSDSTRTVADELEGSSSDASDEDDPVTLADFMDDSVDVADPGDATESSSPETVTERPATTQLSLAEATGAPAPEAAGVASGPPDGGTGPPEREAADATTAGGQRQLRQSFLWEFSESPPAGPTATASDEVFDPPTPTPQTASVL